MFSKFKKYFFLFTLIISPVLLFASPQDSFLRKEFYYLMSVIETDDCYISFIENAEEKFVVKQIKDPSPDEQFLLVLDTLACHIGNDSEIPVNQVEIISPNICITGKKIIELPATLHTFAKGVSTEKESPYQNIDVHQRFRKENSPMWHQWGPLAPEDSGLTMTVMQNMAKHPDLPKIVALDTFLGNADRSPPNLYYDEEINRFEGIDGAASFSSPLALVACAQLKGKKRTQVTQEVLSSLEIYVETLELLVKNWPPEKQESTLKRFSEMAGFRAGCFLYDQNVVDRIEFHKRCINENYKNCLKLIKKLRKILSS